MSEASLMSRQGRATVVESEVVGSGSSCVVQRLELVTQLNVKEMRHVVMGYMNDSAGPQ